MTAESTILRAYAIAAQGNYAEAERLLKSSPESLNSPHGVDLYARILFAAGHRDEARHVWEELVRACPDFESAKRALSEDCKLTIPIETLVTRKKKIVTAAIIAIVIGVAFSVGKLYSPRASAPIDTAPKVIAETVLTEKINGKILTSLKDGFLTNLTEGTSLVISGGQGKYITDRQRKLAVIADCIKEIAKIPVSKMYFQPAEESTDEVRLQIVPSFKPQEANKQ